MEKTYIEEKLSKKRDNEMDVKNESSTAQTKKNKNENMVNWSPKKPKKRLSISTEPVIDKPKKFIYGNYAQYYGYRNLDSSFRFNDVRLAVFQKYKELFSDKDILDIGCNCGLVTMEVAKRFHVKSIVGLDIDRQLIQRALKILQSHKKSNCNNENRSILHFPFNVRFVYGNYVLRDDVLLEIERSQFDLILCLSLTKWIHLHFGDNGLKQAFRRMYLQLRPGGILILEAQPLKSYAKRKHMTDVTFKNYKGMQFLPQDFNNYLLSSEVGFMNVQLMAVPDHHKNGFKRPIYIFYKAK